jgi:hypothetical protein
LIGKKLIIGVEEGIGAGAEARLEGAEGARLIEKVKAELEEDSAIGAGLRLRAK